MQHEHEIYLCPGLSFKDEENFKLRKEINDFLVKSSKPNDYLKN